MNKKPKSIYHKNEEVEEAKEEVVEEEEEEEEEKKNLIAAYGSSNGLVRIHSLSSAMQPLNQ